VRQVGIEITLQELGRHNLQDAGKCDGVFTVDSRLVLNAEKNECHFDTLSILPFQKKYPLEQIDYSTYIHHTDRIVFLAYCDRSIAGEIRLRRNWNYFAYVEDIVVDLHFRRHGVGRLLIQKAIQWAKDKNLPGIMLETQNNNVAACRLYQTCGFELSGFDRRLYQGLDPHSEEIALYWYLIFNPET
jgi:streptothricin acetyltransferase